MRFTVKDLREYLKHVNEWSNERYPKLTLRQDSGVYRIYTEDGHNVGVGLTAKEAHEICCHFLDGIRYGCERGDK